MVFAKDKSLVGKLTDAINDKENTQKIYWALIPSPPPQPEGVWEDYLYHDKQKNKAFAVCSNAKGEIRKGAKYAKLSYSVVHTLPDGLTLVEVRLYTGRTHQIRVQFASRGLPLLGDRKYGSRISDKQGGFALWAHRLIFTHPKTREHIDVKSMPSLHTGYWTMWYSATQASLAQGEQKSDEQGD